jgi:hypothetical protein
VCEGQPQPACMDANDTVLLGIEIDRLVQYFYGDGIFFQAIGIADQCFANNKIQEFF